MEYAAVVISAVSLLIQVAGTILDWRQRQVLRGQDRSENNV
jgi:heme exporter protein D